MGAPYIFIAINLLVLLNKHKTILEDFFWDCFLLREILRVVWLDFLDGNYTTDVIKVITT